MRVWLYHVYQYHKGLFAFFILFAGLQLFIAYKRGMVITPFYNYGMYSAVSKPQPTYYVLELYSKGKRIDPLQHGLHAWDRVLVSYDYIADPDSSKRHYYHTIRRYLSKLGLAERPENFFIDTSLFSPVDQKQKWIRFASQVLRTPIDSAVVKPYHWNGKFLTSQ